MPIDPYTHNFKFVLGDNSYIDGECEFNSDGKASFKMETWSQPLPLETIQEFEKVVSLIKSIYESNGGIKKIVFKEKKE